MVFVGILAFVFLRKYRRKNSAMVLLAAAVCSKNGQAIVSRQFVEMTRARVEGLLSAFSKLLTTDKQHTFVETESVRYVYQPMEKLYMLLITTKASNILEDLETLRLFSRVIPEYCRTLDEREICENSFQIIAAFDEIVALGYRESVNLNQIRTFTEMDSQEEKVYLAVRQTQEREAREVMKRKSRELQQNRREMARSGRGGGAYSGFGGGGMGSGGGSMSSRSMPPEPAVPSYTPVKPPPSSGRAMKLGAKTKGVDSFVDQIVAEGGQVKSVTAPRQSTAAAKLAAASPAHKAAVHIRMEEKITVTAGRDSGLENLEVRGIAQLHISNSDVARCRLQVHNNDERNLQFQTHPNVDKKLFGSESVIALKQAGKAFPINSDVPVLKWRFVSSDESQMPLSINCWPSENDGRCDVNIEYELAQESMELQEVTISIPCPSGVGAPTVDNADGQYSFDSRRSVMAWQLPVIDASNKSGSMEFSMPGRGDDFFPVQVSFVSTKTYCDLAVENVMHLEDEKAVEFTQEKILTVEKYEVA